MPLLSANLCGKTCSTRCLRASDHPKDAERFGREPSLLTPFLAPSRGGTSYQLGHSISPPSNREKAPTPDGAQSRWALSWIDTGPFVGPHPDTTGRLITLPIRTVPEWGSRESRS